MVTSLNDGIINDNGTIEEYTLTVTSFSSEDTAEIGRLVGEGLRKGDLVALMGELGAGKTCLAGGIARGIGVSTSYYITSPTFTIINEYPGNMHFYHLDVYRLRNSEDLEDMGYEDIFYGNGVTVVEWAEKIIDILPESSIIIRLEHRGEAERVITIRGKGEAIMVIKDKLKGGGFS